MKKPVLVVGYWLLAIGLTGCASLMQPTTQVDNATGLAALPPYPGPKAKLAIADFEVKAAKATNEIGSGLREMLVTALVDSNRFSVVERQALSADLIISAAVTEFEPQASGGKAGVGGGGGAASSVFGGLLGASLNKAHMALDLRIIDVSTSEVLASTRVQGQASDMEKAMRICIIEAVRYMSQAIPANYYKY